MPFYITQAHPNPVGKDKAAHQSPTNEKLNQEWIEFANIKNENADLTRLTLHHRTFNNSCQVTGSNQLMSFKGTLSSGHSIRVHTGTGSVYQEGTVWHLFAGKGNFVWNNRCGDTVILQLGDSINDHASYDPNPAEGVVLKRIRGTNKLA
jgi:hypothetical protein